MKTVFMRAIFFSLFVVLSMTVWAQNQVEVLKEDSFLLRGVIKNANQISLAVCHPVNNRVFDIDIQEDGRFEKKLPIIGCEDLYLYLHRTIICMAFPGDTINLEYDAAAKTVNLSGTTPERTREFQLEMLLNGEMRSQMMAVTRYYADSGFRNGGQYILNDTLLNRATEYMRTYLKTVDEFEEQTGKLLHKKQFIARALYDMALCFANAPLVYDELMSLCRGFIPEEFLDEMIFYSSRFNPFLHTRMREFCVRAVTNWLWRGVWDLSFKDMMKVAQTAIPDQELFETFCLNSFYREGYVVHTPLKQLNPEWVTEQIKTPCLQQELKNMIQELSVFLQPGDWAPDFTLKDNTGKKVSLHDFKGKYVYLDFWNTGCSPCIAEFPYTARLVKENPDMKDKIVFLNVCIGQHEASWKELLTKHQSVGVSLYTNSEKDKMIASYKIAGFPTYVLISPEGRVISPYFMRPSMIIGHRASEMNYLKRFIDHYYSEMQNLISL